MSQPPDNLSLDERGRALRTALDLQRRTISARLARRPPGTPGFPRSLTMRILLRRPALVTRVLPLLASTRRLGVLAALLSIAGLVHVVAGARPALTAPAERSPPS